MGDFIEVVQAATAHLFAKRSEFSKARVRIGFWPEGLVISCVIPATTNAQLDANMPEVIPWGKLRDIDAASLIGVIEKIADRHKQARAC